MSNFITVIKDIEFETIEERESFEDMATYFEKGMPNSLYYSPYELSDLTGIHHYEWKKFLKLPQVTQLIESELALLSEIKSRAALKKLGEDEVSTSEVAAIKALLEKSKLLQGKMTDQKTIIFHYIPLSEGSDDAKELTSNEGDQA